MEASGGSGSLLLEVLHWLWLPVLLGSLVALLTSPSWRRESARHTRVAAALTASSVLAELAWRLYAPATVLPLAAWAAAFFALSMALSAVDPRSGSAFRRRQEAPPVEPLAESEAIDDPFRAPPPDPLSFPRGTWAEWSLDQMAEAVAVLSLDGRIELVNAAWARLHGYEVSEVIGHRISLFHTPEQMSRVRQRLEEARADGCQAGLSGHRKKDGTTFTARSSLSLIRDVQNEPAGFIVVAAQEADRDPARAGTEEADPEWEQELETLRVLVGSVAHEFNNLLTGILGNSSLISQRDTAADGDEVGEIEAAARRCAELSKLLQAYAGATQPATQAVTLGPLIAESTAAIERTVKGSAELYYDVSGELPAISADPAQVRLVLHNLVDNAADAFGNGAGRITVRTGRLLLEHADLDRMVMGARRAPGPYVFLEVTDSGIGLDEETRQRMFEPFFTTRPGHRGLGLAAVRSIARAHQGVIDVESEAGAGTRIRVLFPASSSADTSPPATESRPDPQSTAPMTADNADSRPSRDTILVVDNEKIILDLATNVLEIHGYSVLTANEGEPAVALYREHGRKILAVLLDLSMPIMDGEEVFHEILRIDPSAQVILMTGHDAGDVRKGFEDSGLAEVLQKPFKPEQLVGTLRSVLRR